MQTRYWRWSRRQLFLGLTGWVWVIVGWSILTAPPRTDRFGRQIAPFDTVLNSKWSGVLWIVCGAIGIAYALMARWRHTARGFSVLVIPPLLWCLLYGWSWVTWSATSGLYGEPRAWYGAAVWGALALQTMLIAGVSESDPRADTSRAPLAGPGGGDD